MTTTHCISRFVSSISINREAFLNSTVCGNMELKMKDELPLGVTIFLGTLYISASIVGTMGNILAITTVVLNKRMQTVGNLLLLNLTISDLLVTSICMPTIVSYQVFAYPNWPYSEGTCKWSKYIVQLSVLCSVMNLIAIAVHRYILVHRKPSNSCCISISFKHFIVVYWLVAIAATIPAGLYTQLIRLSNGRDIKHLCIEVYSTRDKQRSYMLIRVSTYILTVTVLTIVYTFLALKLRKGDITDHDEERIRERKTAVKLLMAATITFMVCWFPYVIHIVFGIWPPTRTYELQEGFDICGNFLGLFNSVLDPYLYCYFSKSFRRGFRDILMTGRQYFLPGIPNRVQPIDLRRNDAVG